MHFNGKRKKDAWVNLRCQLYVWCVCLNLPKGSRVDIWTSPDGYMVSVVRTSERTRNLNGKLGEDVCIHPGVYMVSWGWKPKFTRVSHIFLLPSKEPRKNESSHTLYTYILSCADLCCLLSPVQSALRRTCQRREMPDIRGSTWLIHRTK